ncbi:MAG TPA: hypothetical protein VEA59_05460 [Patescibacteria group bacterium]|nr:hypothetical protein [Patescibacteria group bacterium]
MQGGLPGLLPEFRPPKRLLQGSAGESWYREEILHGGTFPTMSDADIGLLDFA